MGKDLHGHDKTDRAGNSLALALCLLIGSTALGQSPVSTVVATRQHVKAPLGEPRLSTFVGSYYLYADSNNAWIGPTHTLNMYPSDPLSCASGDLIVVSSSYRGSVNITNSATGGQTWNALTEIEGTNITLTLFWCQFNGTWTADPAFTVTTGTAPFLVGLHVFRPADGSSHVWGVDVAQATGSFSAPSSPYDVTTTGVTTVKDTTVVIITVATADDNAWFVRTSGWGWEGTIDGLNTYAGSDASHLLSYKLHYPYGATGSLVTRQTANGGDAGVYAKVAFK